jgi:hypothetical protein
MASNDAEYYQQHKDDEGEWGDPEPAPARIRRSGSLTAMVSVRLDERELKRIKDAAGERGESVSQFVRQAALTRAGAGRRHVVTLSRTGTAILTQLGTMAVAVPGFANAAATVTGGSRPSFAGAQDDADHRTEMTSL